MGDLTIDNEDVPRNDRQQVRRRSEIQMPENVIFWNKSFNQNGLNDLGDPGIHRIPPQTDESVSTDRSRHPDQSPWNEQNLTEERRRLEIVGDLCDFAHWETEINSCELQVFRFSDLLNKAIETVRRRADMKHLKWDVRIDQDVGDFFQGNTLRLRQILLDIFNNAIRFAENGAIRICVRNIPFCDTLPKRQPKRNELLITVCDPGGGAGEIRFKELLSPAVQADALVSRRYGGSGFGLALARKSIEANGGAMYLAGVPGEGSFVSFTFGLLAERSTPIDGSQPVTTANGRNRTCFKNKRILLADDNEAYRIIIAHLLKRAGIVKTIVVQNGLEAVDAVRNHQIDLVLMDVRKPGMDGPEAVKVIRNIQKPGVDLLPIIALVNYAGQTDVQAGLDAGMNGHLIKPVEPILLAQMLDEMLTPEA